MDVSCLLASAANLCFYILWQTAGMNTGAERSRLDLGLALLTAFLHMASAGSWFSADPPAHLCGLSQGEAWGTVSQGRSMEPCTSAEMKIHLPEGRYFPF